MYECRVEVFSRLVLKKEDTLGGWRAFFAAATPASSVIILCDYYTCWR